MFYLVTFIFCVVLTLLGVIIAFTLFQFWAYHNNAPFITTNDKRIITMLAFIKSHRHKKAIDLGSGNGKIVLALARQGIIAHGYEINLLLVLYSYLRIYMAGLQDKSRFYWKNLWHAPIKEYDLVVIYGLKPTMDKLQDKLKKEMKPHTTVVTIGYPLPRTTARKESNGVYLYEF